MAVPDDPITPLIDIEGDGTGPDIWRVNPLVDPVPRDDSQASGLGEAAALVK